MSCSTSSLLSFSCRKCSHCSAFFFYSASMLQNEWTGFSKKFQKLHRNEQYEIDPADVEQAEACKVIPLSRECNIFYIMLPLLCTKNSTMIDSFRHRVGQGIQILTRSATSFQLKSSILFLLFSFFLLVLSRHSFGPLRHFAIVLFEFALCANSSVTYSIFSYLILLLF